MGCWGAYQFEWGPDGGGYMIASCWYGYGRSCPGCCGIAKQIASLIFDKEIQVVNRKEEVDNKA